MNHYSFSDRLCLLLDNALRATAGEPRTTGRPSPAANVPDASLSDSQRRHAAACMRINHAGEVAAQGLYHGQALVSHSETLRHQLEEAAIEEGDHLAWCSERLKALDSHKSWLTPFWYAGSFLIGVVAGIAGDRLSLGFLAETETQVMKHLEKHLDGLPPEDEKSLSILQRMHEDEKQHRDTAIDSGGAELPWGIKKLMGLASAIMVKTAYWI